MITRDAASPSEAETSCTSKPDARDFTSFTGRRVTKLFFFGVKYSRRNHHVVLPRFTPK